MGDKTNIAWTDATWNPLRARHKETGAEGWACVRVSPGCQHCYAEALNETKRFGRGTGLGYTVPALEKVEHYLHEETLNDPLRWQRPRKIFVCSMTDLFGEWVSDAQIDRIFAVMALAPRHTFQVLTKRPERMRAYVQAAHARVASAATHPPLLGPGVWRNDPEGLAWPLRNLWCGVTAEDQERADERIPLLLDAPAAVRFVSYEPALGPVNFGRWIPYGQPCDREHGPIYHAHCSRCGLSEALEENDDGLDWEDTEHVCPEGFGPSLDWLIVGGESGSGARPFDVAWARSVVSQGRAAGVPVFVKQMGSRPFSGAVRLRYKHPHGANPAEWPADLRVQEFPEVRS